jgi:hypothetical protein
MNQNNTTVEQSEQRPAKENASARWRKLIEQQRESGLPVAAYCRERGVSAASMFAWRRRLSGAAETFKPVKVVSGPAGCAREVEKQAGSAIELCLRGGRQLIVRRGFDRQLLAELVEAMESLA